MKIVSKSAIDVSLKMIQDEVNEGYDKEWISATIDNCRKFLAKYTWEDQNYYFDRKTKTIKSLNEK